MTLKELTQEQWDAIPPFRDYWKGVVLDTGPTDLPAAIKAVEAAYTESGEKFPGADKVLHMQSPLGGLYATDYLVRYAWNLAEKVDLRKHRFPSQETIDSCFPDEESKGLYGIRKRLWVQILGVLVKSTGKSRVLHDDATMTDVGFPLLDQIDVVLNADNYQQHSSQACYAQGDVNWLCFYKFMIEVLGLSSDRDPNPHLEVAKLAGWWIPLDDAVVICDRASAVHYNDEDQAHCEDGAAIVYRDGSGIYYWNGVRIPKWVIHDLTVDRIRNEENIEIRRCAIERYGPKFLSDAGCELVDMDTSSSGPRALYRDDQGDQWLVGTDGSTKRVYHMSVPEEAKTCKEAHEAIAGFDESRLILEV